MDQEVEYAFDSSSTEDSAIARAAAVVAADPIDWQQEPNKFSAWYPYQFRMRCRSLMYRLGLTEEDAKDIVQASFLELLNQDSILYPKTRDAFLCRLCVCRAIDFLRKRGQRRFVPLDDGVANLVYDASLNTALAETIWEALSSLDEKHQVILIMKYMDGYTFDEIAQGLTLPPTTVKPRHYAALNKFAHALGTVRKINKHSKNESGSASGAAHVAGGLR